MLAASAHELFSNWFAAQSGLNVSFNESFPSIHDPADDYRVTYEAIFQPASLDKARIEIWVTDEGRIGLGFETRQRIAARLGLTNWRDGFATGHEPRELTSDGVLALLSAVAEGRISLAARTIFGVLGRIRAVISGADRQALAVAGYNYLDWIEVAEEPMRPLSFGALIRFQPWRL